MSDVTPRQSSSAVTESSESLRTLARELISTCPPSLGSEIALTGSAARGTADRYSDLELNFWADEVPPQAERAEWLWAAGATDLALDFETISDGTIWSTIRWRGVWIEAGWQTVGRLEEALSLVLAGATTDHHLLLLPWMLGRALPLRTRGSLESWRQSVSRYPDGLSERLIESAIAGWLWPHWVATHWALVARGESLALARALVDDACAALRVLFAVNREWEADWKWARSEAPRLERQPDRLLDRLDAIFGADDPAWRIATCLELILDILALAPPSESVDRAREVVGACLAEGPPPGRKP